MFPFDQSLSSKQANKKIVFAEALDGSKEASKLSQGLFALRRANKNRRQQLHKATLSKKERIVNSKIPGVDYSRRDQPNRQANSRLTSDSIFENLYSATLHFPEELIKKMNSQGFLILDPRKNCAMFSNKTSKQSSPQASVMKIPSDTKLEQTLRRIETEMTVTQPNEVPEEQKNFQGN